MPGHATTPRSERDLGGCGLRHQVGGHDGVCATSSNRSGRKRLRQSRQRSDDLARIHLDADHSGRSGKDLRRPAVGALRPPLGRSQRDLVPVRVAQLALPALTRTARAIRERSSGALRESLNRSGLHAVLREHGGGTGRKPANDQRQIVLLLLANAGIHGRVAYPSGRFIRVALPLSLLSVRNAAAHPLPSFYLYFQQFHRAFVRQPPAACFTTICPGAPAPASGAPALSKDATCWPRKVV